MVIAASDVIPLTHARANLSELVDAGRSIGQTRTPRRSAVKPGKSGVAAR